MVDVALAGDRRADALGEEAGGLDLALAFADPGDDGVADTDRSGGLDELAVDSHVTGPAGRRGIGARPEEPDGPQPLIHSHRVDLHMIAQRLASTWSCRRFVAMRSIPT